MKSLADVLGAALKRTGSPGALKTIWERAVGEIIARHSTPARWEGETLIIRVEGAWRAALQAELQDIPPLEHQTIDNHRDIMPLVYCRIIAHCSEPPI